MPRRLVAIALVLATASCASTTRIRNADIPPTEAASVRTQVLAAEARRGYRLGIEIVGDVADYPKAQAAMVALGYLHAGSAGRDTYTAAGLAASTPCGRSCRRFTLLTDHFERIDSVEVTPPGPESRGGRLYTIGLRVEPTTALGMSLARSGALFCGNASGAPGPVPTIAPTIFFTAFDPKFVNPLQHEIGIRPDCPILR